VPIWQKEQFVDGAVWADGEAFPSDIALPGASVAAAQSADGEAFPVGVGLGEESGRPSDDAHISESRYGAPGSVGGRKLEAGE
jgi:hypothetical protein